MKENKVEFPLTVEVYNEYGALKYAYSQEANFDSLNACMKKELYEGNIPIVRRKEKVSFRKYKPFEWAGGCLETTAEPIQMKLQMKVDQQTLNCEGFGHEVLKAQENFLRAIIPDLRENNH
jgi:hypothetical protein